MRLLLLILVLINIGLFSYFNQHLFGAKAPQTQLPEISPEKLMLLSQAELEALPKRVTMMTPLSQLDPLIETCYEWGIFTAANAIRAEMALKNLNLKFVTKQETPKEAKRFWVYRQPLPTSDEAQQKVAELKALGIEDLFVVQEPKWKNAISFGVFSDEKLATKLLNELQAKGIRNVVKALRNQGNNPVSFKLSALSTEELENVKVLQPDYADSTLTEVSCK
jgi:hypothetical protein